MTRKAMLLLAVLLFASQMIFAQTHGTANAPSESRVQWVVIGAGLSMAFASGLCGLAQAKAIAAAANGMALNPGASGTIRNALLVGLALIQWLALYALFAINDLCRVSMMR